MTCALPPAHLILENIAISPEGTENNPDYEPCVCGFRTGFRDCIGCEWLSLSPSLSFSLSLSLSVCLSLSPPSLSPSLSPFSLSLALSPICLTFLIFLSAVDQPIGVNPALVLHYISLLILSVFMVEVGLV